jgi:hypothetical protein
MAKRTCSRRGGEMDCARGLSGLKPATVYEPDGASLKLFVANRTQFARVADYLAVALVASLPWSTSATSILAALWLIFAIPGLDPRSLRRVSMEPAAYWPLILVALGAAGMLWADVTWPERFNGIGSFLKLLLIPLLICHFSDSKSARPVLIGFICSGTLLLIYSWALFVWPELPAASATKARGIPVKDYISQSAMFAICLFVLVQIGLDYWRAHRRDLALASIALALIFLSNILYIATSRTALVVVVAILVVFGFRQFKLKGAIAFLVGFFILAAAAWPSATYLQVRVNTFVNELNNFQPDGPPTPAGERLVFWTKSIGFIEAAPVIGHGTGSIHDQFVRSTVGRTGMAAEDATNPHNQILAIGIQLGFVGIAVMLAMWIAHLMLFRYTGLAAWVGLVVAIQNIVGSLFNSHLADFTHGWLYVIGVGVAGGIALGKSGALPDRIHNAN